MLPNGVVPVPLSHFLVVVVNVSASIILMAHMNSLCLVGILQFQRPSYTYTYGEHGWRNGESTRLPPMWPGFDSRSRRHMWVEFVVAPRGFSPGTPVFPSPLSLGVICGLSLLLVLFSAPRGFSPGTPVFPSPLSLGVICGLSLLLVLFSAPRGFSPGTPVFPSPQKPTLSKFQLDPDAVDDKSCGCPLLNPIIIITVEPR